MATMRKNEPHAFRIAVLTDATYKAAREKCSGVLRYAAKHPHFHPIIQNIHKLAEVKSVLSWEDIQGIICLWADTPLVRTIKTISAIPTVWADAIPTGGNTVSINDNEIAAAASKLLLQRGLRHFAFVHSNLAAEQSRSAKRAESFNTAITKAGFRCDMYMQTTKAKSLVIDEIPILANWLTQLPKPCGILAYADDRAQTIIDACNLAHIRIPDQVNILSVDNDTEICENTRPELSSIWPDFEKAGYLCAQELHRRLVNGKAKKPRRHSYGVRCIIERASTQDLRGGGRIVSLANEYILGNYCTSIKSTDIAKALKVSRRLLDMRFREITGTTVQKTVEHLRLTKARHLLLHTTSPIEQIARQCGYSTTLAFRKAFVSNFNMSPKTFRDNNGADD